MAAIKPLLVLCQSTQRKVKFSSHFTNLCWPFQADVSNPVRFLHFSRHLLNQSKHNQQRGLSKNKQPLQCVCVQHQDGRGKRRRTLNIYSSGTCCHDKTMTHSDTFLWHWQRSNAEDKPWRHNKVTQNHLESLHEVFLLPVMCWFPIWEHMIQHCLEMLSMFTAVRR